MHFEPVAILTQNLGEHRYMPAAKILELGALRDSYLENVWAEPVPIPIRGDTTTSDRGKVRVIWACWTTDIAYDPTRHHAEQQLATRT